MGNDIFSAVIELNKIRQQAYEIYLPTDYPQCVRICYLLLSFLSVAFATLASWRFQHIGFTKDAHQSDKFIFGEFAIFDS